MLARTFCLRQKGIFNWKHQFASGKMTFLAGNINSLQAKRSRQHESTFSLRLLALASESVHLPQAFWCYQWKRQFASGFWASSVETLICLRLLNAENKKQAFARGCLTPQRRATIFRRISCDTKRDNPKRKVAIHRPSRRAKAEG